MLFIAAMWNIRYWWIHAWKHCAQIGNTCTLLFYYFEVVYAIWMAINHQCELIQYAQSLELQNRVYKVVILLKATCIGDKSIVEH